MWFRFLFYLMISHVDCLFRYQLAICLSFWGKLSIQFLRPFFIIGLLFTYLFVCCGVVFWDMNPLLDTRFAGMFSHFISCSFILLIISFAEQMLLSLIKTHLCIFAFVSCAIEVKHKKSLPGQMPRSCLFF